MTHSISSSRIFKLALPVFAVALAMFGAKAHANPIGNVIVNGSFETVTSPNPGNYICSVTAGCTASTSNVAGWAASCSSYGCGNSGTAASIITDGTGTQFNNTGLLLPVAASDGNNYIAIDGNSLYSSSISQTVNGLVVGTTYTLSFSQAADIEASHNGTTTEQWAVTFGSSIYNAPTMTAVYTPYGTSCTTVTASCFTGWETETTTFTATSASETLTFAALGTPGGTGYPYQPPVVLLDNVQLVGAFTTPEPGTLGLMFSGLLAGAGVLRARMRRTA